MVARQFHAAQQLVRVRAQRNPNEVIEETHYVWTAHRRFGRAVRRIVGLHYHLRCRSLIVYYGDQHTRPQAWDPYPFILLNLFLSMLAAIQAPVIMMSQNRQDTKDRLRSELDFDVNRRAATDIQGLARKMNLVSERVEDLEEMLRAKGTAS